MRLSARLQSTLRTAIARNSSQSQLRYTIQARRLQSTTTPNMATPSETKPETNTESQAPLSLPALPSTKGGAPTLEVGGSALKLDHLGPLVVNEDGTLSRIANWDKMIDIERENTLRILGKRNQMRLAKLRAKAEQEAAEAKTEGDKQ